MKLPLQDTRSEGKTMMGAVGALSKDHEDRKFHFLYIIVEKTVKETVIIYFQHIIDNAQVPIDDIVIVLDNHASHHSHMLRDFAEENSLHLLFLPSYSSVLNPVERVWAWTKQMFT